MAAIKLIVSSLSLPRKFRTGGDSTKLQPWSTKLPSSPAIIRPPTNDKRQLVVAAVGFLQEPAAAAVIASDIIVNNFQYLQTHPSSSSFIFSLAAAAESTGYSLASYYTSLGLFVISVPGLWSLIKRSVKSKIVKKSFVGGGEGEEGTTTKMKEPKQMAGEILSFFTRNNFVVTDRGETITFEGEMVPSRGQAALLTFCTCISLGSVALVLTITVPDVGDKWYYLTILSPLAGIYYWKKASRKEQIQVKMIVSEDGTLSEIVVQGDDQQVEQMRKELQLSEKGMVYVKGIFER